MSTPDEIMKTFWDKVFPKDAYSREILKAEPVDPAILLRLGVDKDGIDELELALDDLKITNRFTRQTLKKLRDDEQKKRDDEQKKRDDEQKKRDEEKIERAKTLLNLDEQLKKRTLDTENSEQSIAKRKTSQWDELRKLVRERLKSVTKTDPNIIDTIGSTFTFMNREQQLVDFYNHLVKRYTRYSTKLIDKEKKLPFKMPCIFSATGMGKTTFFSKGIEKMLTLPQVKSETKFYPIMADCYKKGQVITLDFAFLSNAYDKDVDVGLTKKFNDLDEKDPAKAVLRMEYYEKLLCNWILNVYLGSTIPFKVAPGTTLGELLRILSDESGCPFFILHFDEVQTVIPNSLSKEKPFSSLTTAEQQVLWKGTILYELSHRVIELFRSENNIKVVMTYTGLNSVDMDGFFPLSATAPKFIHLNLHCLC